MAAEPGKIGKNLLAEFHPGEVFDPDNLGRLVPKNFNDDIFEELVNTLYNMLRFERKNPSPDSNLFIKELTGNILSKIIIIIKNKPGFISRNTLMYFRETGKTSVINTIFSKIKKHLTEVDLKNSQLGYVLGRKSPLYQTNFHLINRKLDELLSSNDPILIKLGKQLREQIMLSR